MTKKKWEVYPSNLGNCVTLTKSPPAAILLYRIYCREGKSSFKDSKGKKGWAVLTREEWMVDTGLTRNQYDRALAKLKSLDYLEYKYEHKWGRYGNPPIWIKLKDKIKWGINGIQY